MKSVLLQVLNEQKFLQMVNQIRPFPKEKVIPILETVAKKKRKKEQTILNHTIT